MARDFWWTNQRFFPLSISLHHGSPCSYIYHLGELTIGPFVAAVQRRGLIPSTWSWSSSSKQLIGVAEVSSSLKVRTELSSAFLVCFLESRNGVLMFFCHVFLLLGTKSMNGTHNGDVPVHSHVSSPKLLGNLFVDSIWYWSPQKQSLSWFLHKRIATVGKCCTDLYKWN
jgi:hypothetical protein